MFASMSPPAAQPGLPISKIWETDHENADLQLRSLGLRASVCNRVPKRSLFVSISAALRLQCKQ